MDKVIKQWKLGKIEAKARKEGIEINGRTIPWSEVEEARRIATQSEFRIPIIGSAK